MATIPMSRVRTALKQDICWLDYFQAICMVAFIGPTLMRVCIYCVCSEYLSRVSKFFLHNKQIALLSLGHYLLLNCSLYHGQLWASFNLVAIQMYLKSVFIPIRKQVGDTRTLQVLLNTFTFDFLASLPKRVHQHHFPEEIFLPLLNSTYNFISFHSSTEETIRKTHIKS